MFEHACKAGRIPVPKAEFVFAPPRKWRFDWAWPEYKIALEVEGGIYRGGRHTSLKGFLADMEKYNRAACLGWRLLRCTPDEFKKGDVIALLQEIFFPPITEG